MKNVKSTVIGAFSIVILVSLLSTAISFFGYNKVIDSVNDIQVNKTKQDMLQELLELSAKRQQLASDSVASVQALDKKEFETYGKNIEDIADRLINSGIGQKDKEAAQQLVSINKKYSDMYLNTMSEDLRAFDNKSIAELSKGVQKSYDSIQKDQWEQKNIAAEALEKSLANALYDTTDINRKLKLINSDSKDIDSSFVEIKNLLADVLGLMRPEGADGEAASEEMNRKIEALKQGITNAAADSRLVLDNSEVFGFDRVLNMKQLKTQLEQYQKLAEIINLTAQNNSQLMYSAAAFTDVSAAMEKNRGEMERLLAELAGTGLDKEVLASLKTRHSEYNAAAAEITKRSAIMREADIAKGYKSLTDMNREFTGNINKLRTSFNSYLAEDIKTSERIKSVIIWIFTGISILSVFIGMLIAFVLSRKIANPINSLAAILSRVEKGDLTVRANIESEGEIGGLSRKVNSVLDGQQRMVEQFKNTTSEIGNLKQRLTSLVDQNRETVSRMNTGRKAPQKGTAAFDTESIMTDVRAVSQQTQKAVDDSKKVAELAKSREKTVEEAEVVINTVNETVKSIALSISKLEASSGKIGEITNTITQIASQTNLLALNAAIEANRAGQQGKGFAIVADEIRKLSNASNQSAVEIKNQIKEIQACIGTAVEKMNAGVVGVEDGASRIYEVKAGISEIIQSVNLVTQAIKESADKAYEHYESTVQFIEAVDSMSRAAAETSSDGDSINNIIDVQNNTLKDLDQISMLLHETSDDLKDIWERVKI